MKAVMKPGAVKAKAAKKPKASSVAGPPDRRAAGAGGRRRIWKLLPAAGLLAGLAGLAFARAEPSSNNPFHICVFHITDEKDSEHEAYNTKKLQTRLEEFGTDVPKGSVKVKAYGVEETKNIRRAFRKMAGDASHKCDSLMISGNHMGHFYGEKKALFLKDLEEMACEKGLKDWFAGIKALWLHGSGTVTDDNLADLRGAAFRNLVKDHKYTKGESDRRTRSFLSEADKSIQHPRVTARIQHAYKASIDERSPLSSRYLRSFPNAQIYGFFDKAPTSEDLSGMDAGNEELEKGQSHLFHHIVKIGKIIDTSLTDQHGRAFVEGIKALAANEEACETIRATAWEKGVHDAAQSVYGKSYKGIRQLGCDLIQAKQVLDNPDASAEQKAAAKTKIKKTLDRINQLDKALSETGSMTDDKIKKIFGADKSAEDIQKIKAEVQRLKRENLKASHLLFSNIYDTWKLAGAAGDNNFKNQVKAKLKQDTFKTALSEKIDSLVQPVLAKADYLKFCKEISCDANIKDKTNQIITAQITAAEGDDTGSRILAASAIDQLNQYDLISKEQAAELAANTQLFPADEASPYIQQIQKGLQYQGMSADKILKDVGEAKEKAVADGATNNDKAAYELAVRTAARDFFRDGDSASLSEAIQTVPYTDSGQKDAVLNSLANDMVFYAQFDPNPEKQAKDLFHQIKDMTSGNYNEDVWRALVGAARSMQQETRDFFVKQMESPAGKNIPYRQIIIDRVKTGPRN